MITDERLQTMVATMIEYRAPGHPTPDVLRADVVEGVLYTIALTEDPAPYRARVKKLVDLALTQREEGNDRRTD